MTTRRENILDNIKTTLQSITVANGYSTTIDTVESVVKDWDAVNTGQFPWIGFSSDPREGSEFEYEPNGKIKVTFGVAIIAHLIALPGDAKNQALSNLEADIIKAMHVDHRRGGYALDSKIKTSMTDEGDDHLYVNKPTGTIVQTWDITYFVHTDDLE